MLDKGTILMLIKTRRTEAYCHTILKGTECKTYEISFFIKVPIEYFQTMVDLR